MGIHVDVQEFISIGGGGGPPCIEQWVILPRQKKMLAYLRQSF